MKRALLSVLILVIVTAAAVLLLAVRTDCPGCEGVGLILRRSSYVPVYPGCPRCEDDGGVTWARRLWKGAPHPDVKAAFLASWDESDAAQEAYAAALRRLIGQSGLKVDIGEDPSGRVVYLHDGVDVLLGIEAELRREGETDRVVLLLCDEGGSLLDHLTVSWARIRSPVFVGGQWSTGDREARAFHFSRTGIDNPTSPAFQVEHGAERTTVTAARFAIQARRGRWQIRPPGEAR